MGRGNVFSIWKKIYQFESVLKTLFQNVHLRGTISDNVPEAFVFTHIIYINSAEEQQKSVFCSLFKHHLDNGSTRSVMGCKEHCKFFSSNSGSA